MTSHPKSPRTTGNEAVELLLKPSTEADFLIIGKTVPIFRGPEPEGTLCSVGSALREVKLNALSRAIRVSFRAFYKHSTY